MYQASELFERAISQMSRELSFKCTINGKVYTDSEVQDCSIEESILTSDDFKLGSATASTMDLTLLNMDESLSANSFEGKEVLIEIGAVLDRFSQPMEYVSMGTFIIEKAIKEKNLIKLTGIDKMILFEKPYVSSLQYPSTLLQILQEVCSLAGVTLENKPFLNQDYLVESQPDLENVTLRNVLEYISELACGFACINRGGKLDIYTFTDTNISINGDNYYSMNVSEYNYKPINRVVIKTGEAIKEVGVGTNTIEIINNIFAAIPTDQLINNIYNSIENFEFKPFTTTWQGNVLTAPADIITVSEKDNEVYKSFIAKQKFVYSTGLKCEIATNTKTAIQTAYQSGGTITKKIEKTKKELQSKIEITDEKFTQEFVRVDQSISTIEQTADEIQLSVEAINDSIATIQVEAGEISLSVQDLDSRVGSAEASIVIQADQISSKVSQTDYNGNTISSLINQTATDILIQAERVNLNGYATFTSLQTPGQTIIDGGNIQTGTMSADRIFGGTFRLSNNSTIYEEPNYGGTTQMIFTSGAYKFEAASEIDFSGTRVTGLTVVASFG